MAKEHKYKGKVPLHDKYGPEAKFAVEAEALLPTTKLEEEVARGLELGLPALILLETAGFPPLVAENSHISPALTRLSKPRMSKTSASAVNTMSPFSARRSMAARRIGPARGSGPRAFARFRPYTDLIASNSAWTCGNPSPLRPR